MWGWGGATAHITFGCRNSCCVSQLCPRQRQPHDMLLPEKSFTMASSQPQKPGCSQGGDVSTQQHPPRGKERCGHWLGPPPRPRGAQRKGLELSGLGRRGQRGQGEGWHIQSGPEGGGCPGSMARGCSVWDRASGCLPLAMPTPETRCLPALVPAWHPHHAVLAHGAAGDSRPGPCGRAWPRGEADRGKPVRRARLGAPAVPRRAPSTIPLRGQPGGWVLSRRLAADMSRQTGALAGSAPGLRFTSPRTGAGGRRPWMGWGNPRLAVQGGHRELHAAKRAKGDHAEGEDCSVPTGMLWCCCCHTLRLHQAGPLLPIPCSARAWPGCTHPCRGVCTVAPLTAELQPRRHSSLGPAEWQRAQAGAAGRSGRGSLAFWVQSGGWQGCSKAWGGRLWGERGRTWVFEDLVEGAYPLLVLEMGRKALARVLM